MSRPHHATVTGKPAKWDIADAEIRNRLIDLKNKGGNIRILTGTILSPSTKQVIADFLTAYPTAKHVVYDPVSFAGIAIA